MLIISKTVHKHQTQMTIKTLKYALYFKEPYGNKIFYKKPIEITFYTLFNVHLPLVFSKNTCKLLTLNKCLLSGKNTLVCSKNPLSKTLYHICAIYI